MIKRQTDQKQYSSTLNYSFIKNYLKVKLMPLTMLHFWLSFLDGEYLLLINYILISIFKTCAQNSVDGCILGFYRLTVGTVKSRMLSCRNGLGKAGTVCMAIPWSTPFACEMAILISLFVLSGWNFNHEYQEEFQRYFVKSLVTVA